MVNLIFKESFNIGTIRLLKRTGVMRPCGMRWRNLSKQRPKGYHHVTAIGSGGNINKIFSLSKRKEGKPLSLESLRDYYKEFSGLSLEQRMSLYKLREDRADVIVPALLIYINVMRWTDTEEIFVPKTGLADGWSTPYMRRSGWKRLRSDHNRQEWYRTRSAPSHPRSRSQLTASTISSIFTDTISSTPNGRK